jgi:hypothetical protein
MKATCRLYLELDAHMYRDVAQEVVTIDLETTMRNLVMMMALL